VKTFTKDNVFMPLTVKAKYTATHEYITPNCWAPVVCFMQIVFLY